MLSVGKSKVASGFHFVNCPQVLSYRGIWGPFLSLPCSIFSFFFFFNYRSNLGHLSLYHINLESPYGELEAFSFVLTLYPQCLQRPPGGRGRVQETIGFGREWGFLPRLPICLESRCRCSGRHLWSFLRMQCSSPFPASSPSGCYCLTSVSLGKHSTWTSCP